MLKMKVDLDELLKTKGKRKRRTVDLDECLKTKGLRDHRGEARMLLKVRGLVARTWDLGVRSQEPEEQVLGAGDWKGSDG
jgi:hypothetical protein